MRISTSRSLIVTPLLTLAVLVGVLVFSAVPASAKEAHVFSSHFGSAGSGAGEMELQAASPGVSGSEVAVNSTTHDVYVADTGNDRVDEFEPGGKFVRAWGWGVAGGIGFETCASMCVKGLSGSNPGEFEAPAFIAVDNSGGESEGDVYVGDAGDNLVTKFSEDGVLVKSWGDSSLNGPAPQGQLDGSSTPATSFALIAGIAVDTAGNLDVLQLPGPHTIFSFAQDGTFTGHEFPTIRSTGPDGLAVNAAGEFFKVTGGGGVLELTSAGKVVGRVSHNNEEGASVHGIAATGSDLYVVESGGVGHYAISEPGVVTQPGNPACTIEEEKPCPPSDSFGEGRLTDGSGVAVDPSSGDVFVADAGAGDIVVFVTAVVPEVSTGKASEEKAFSATLNGKVNPDGVVLTDCHFDYVPKAQFEASKFEDVTLAEQKPCVPAAGTIPTGSGEQPVEAAVTGLQVGTTYEVRLQAENAAAIPAFGEPPVPFETAPPPELTAAEVSNLSKESVDLNVQVNPGGIPLKSCAFEYGTAAGVYPYNVQCSPELLKQIGEGKAPVPISQHIDEHIAPNETYHWRVVATSEAGTTTGVDHTFIYDEKTPTTLPDGRAYEMVTPPLKNGALLGNVLLQKAPAISDDGSHVILTAVQCFDGSLSCVVADRKGIGAPYLFSRTATGWTTTPLAPPATQFKANTWYLSNPDTQISLFSMPTAPFDEDGFYGGGPEGVFTDIGPLSPPAEGPIAPERFINDVQDVAGTADLSHLVFWAGPFWPDSKTPQASPDRADSLFQYPNAAAPDEPALVGVSGGLGSTELVSECGTRYATEAAAESADGRIVYFTAEGCNAGGTGANEGIPIPVEELFARVDGGEPKAHTVAISEPDAPQVHDERNEECTDECEANTASPTPPATNPNWRPSKFGGTSSDGSKTFFESEQQLTNEATQGSNNLYLYDMKAPEGHRWVDVSAGEGGIPAAGGPRVQGELAYSSDGSHVYFVAQGVLTTAPSADAQGHGPHGEPVRSGAVAQSGAENLYAFDTETRQTSFIATMSPSDASDWQLPGSPANVSPGGRFLVFPSKAALTTDVTRTDGAEQIYRYDAQTGRLQRISIGERGYDDDGNAGAGDASIVRGVDGEIRLGEPRLDPTMSNDGSRVFFMDPVALTPRALNDVVIGTERINGRPGLFPGYAQNIYEWEQPGVGGCSAKEASGCTFLLSDGHDTGVLGGAEACFPDISTTCLLGTDESGANVFFTTADELVKADTDTQLDVYDARVCEPEHGNPCIAEPPEALPPCLGETCHGIPPERSPAAAGPTETFNGALNPTPTVAVVKPKALTRAQKLAAALKQCRKEKSKSKRVKCEKAARKSFGPVKKTTAKKKAKR
jgi:hypothetical protein